MKTFYLVMFFSVVIFSISFAQSDYDKAANEVEKLSTLVKLDKEQYAKVLKIQLRNNENKDIAKRAMELVKLNKIQYDSEIQEILTPEQNEKLKIEKRKINDSITNRNLPPWMRKEDKTKK